jgi:aspartate/methionine/tyrosine aminotransferase
VIGNPVRAHPPFEPFALERWQSRHERTVEFNLADSACRCAPLGSLLHGGDVADLLGLELYYPEVNGSVAVRDSIAALYTDADPAQVLVTVGAAEANLVVCQTLLAPGDEVVVMEPGYRQVWGLAHNLGCTVRPLRLREDWGWRPDLDALEQSVTDRTKLVYVVNPNNPTGVILTEEERRRIVDIVTRADAWLLADEVYRGSERFAATETPSLWGLTDRVIVVNSLSKAYGLCGLRIGWVVAPEELIDAFWARHEYAVIAASAPSMVLAELALREPNRSGLLARQRAFVRGGWDLLERWLGREADLVSVACREATALAFVRYHFDWPSLAVADAIRREASVLVAPGAFMGAERHLRITHGFEPAYVAEALARVGAVLRDLSTREAPQM